jgi:hypothetical protein
VKQLSGIVQLPNPASAATEAQKQGAPLGRPGMLFRHNALFPLEVLAHNFVLSFAVRLPVFRNRIQPLCAQ